MYRQSSKDTEHLHTPDNYDIATEGVDAFIPHDEREISLSSPRELRFVQGSNGLIKYFGQMAFPSKQLLRASQVFSETRREYDVPINEQVNAGTVNGNALLGDKNISSNLTALMSTPHRGFIRNINNR